MVPTQLPITPVPIADNSPSDTETDIADDSSDAPTEIVPFVPKLLPRLNLPPRLIPTPPLPEVKSIDFAYRPKPSLDGLPHRPIDPKWVVPRLPMPPGCDKSSEIPGIRQRWISDWEAKQDKPGGIYRTGRNRADGRRNPRPFISAIVTPEGIRGYTSEGWVSPSTEKSELEQKKDREQRWLGSRHGHQRSQEATRPDYRRSKNTTDSSSSVKQPPVPPLLQPVPNQAFPIPPICSHNPAAAATAIQETKPVSSGRKRNRTEMRREKNAGDTVCCGSANLENSDREWAEADSFPLTKKNTHTQARKTATDVGYGIKPTFKITSEPKKAKPRVTYLIPSP